nr:MAG TPA: hypothetical protein [Caudoviricetes sp.]
MFAILCTKNSKSTCNTILTMVQYGHKTSSKLLFCKTYLKGETT